MTIRELFTRDIGRRVANEGVAKVWHEDVLVQELEDYVITDEIAADLAHVLDAFLDSMDMRKRGNPREGMSVWVSGFFGSGKSHFAKVLGHLLADTELDAESGTTALDVIRTHVEQTERATELTGYLHRLQTQVTVHPVMIEMKSKEDLIRPDSIAEICMAGFYESLGFSRTLYVASIEEMLASRGVFDDFRHFYEEEFGERWEVGRGKHIFNRPRIAKALVHCLSDEFDDVEDAEAAIEDAHDEETITADSFAETILSHLDRMAADTGQREPHVVFVLDEMQQFIGDDDQKIEELRTLVESLGALGHGRIWVVCCGQEALDKVVDRTGLNLAALGKLAARFSLRVDLRSEHVTKVITDLLLRKKEAVRPELSSVYSENGGFLATCCDLDLERHLPQTQLNEEAFISSYPFLPHLMLLSQRIFDTMRGTKLSGNERSMLAITQPILAELAVEPLGSLVPLDWVFDEIENELCSDDHLGTHGVNAIKASDGEVSGWDIEPSRCLKVLWLVQRLNWVSRSADNIARLLVDDIAIDLSAHREHVRETLELLRRPGYVALEEGLDQYRFLSPEEGEVEKALADRQAGYGVGVVVRRSREIIKSRVLTRSRLDEFRVLHGASQAPIEYSLRIDDEEVTSRGEIQLEAFGPLSPVDRERIERECLAAGTKGRTVWWVAEGDGELENRLKRLEALEWLIDDPKHKAGRSAKYIEAVEEKRQEAEDLEQALADRLAECFRRGTIYYAGETVDLEGDGPLGSIVHAAMEEVIPNLYTRFDPADVNYDPEAVERLMDPATGDLQEATSGLSLFDGSGALLPSAPLIEPVLEELQRREDEADDLTGKGISDHFAAIPFGWPEDLVRVVMAAAVRGGAVAVVTGGRKHFDHSESAVVKALTGVREFRRAQFVATEVPPQKDIIEARNLLIELGIPGVQESVNAEARAVRQLAQRYVADARSAETMARMGLPLPETYKRVETACAPLIEENDPTKVVRGLLDAEDTWREIGEFFDDIEEFRAENRERTYTRYQELIDRCQDNRALQHSEQASVAQQALAELRAMEEARTVVSRWPTYRENAEKLQAAYRQAYRAQLNQAAQGADDLRVRIERMHEWEELESDARQAIMERYFETGGELCILDPGDIADLDTLLSLSKKQSLEALETMVTGLPSYEREIMAAVREALADQQREQGVQVQKSFVWRAADELVGRRFETRNDMCLAFEAVQDRLGEKLDQGFIIIVE